MPTYFPSLSCQHTSGEATDQLLRAELKAAGVSVVQRAERNKAFLSDVTGVVADCWTFERDLFSWAAQGPAIPRADARRLYDKYGGQLRIDGFEGVISPDTWCRGEFGVGFYHVESAEALAALVDTIQQVAARAVVA